MARKKGQENEIKKVDLSKIKVSSNKLRPFYLAQLLHDETNVGVELSTTQIEEILREVYGIETDRKRIKEDASMLCKLGMDIQVRKSVVSYYSLVNRLFEEAELKLLVDAVAAAKFISQDTSKEMIEKIQALTSKTGRAKLLRNISYENKGADKRTSKNDLEILLVVDRILEAIESNKGISYTYATYRPGKGRIQKSTESVIVKPLHLVWNGDNYYVIVSNGKKQDSSRRVDRFLNVEVCDLDPKGQYLNREDVDMKDFQTAAFRMYRTQTQEIELLFNETVTDSIVDKFGYENFNRSISDGDGWYRVTVKVCPTHIFYSWIFGFQGLVKILSEEHKKQYMDMLEKALQEG